MRNAVKSKLKDGKVVFGISLGIESAEVPYALGEVGLDWVNLDMQHTPIGLEKLPSLIQAMSYSETVPIVRVQSNDPGLINKALDMGAKAVIVPLVNTREEAKKAVLSARYGPAGLRSWGGRASLRDPDYSTTADREVMIIPQIETEAALTNLESIITTDGIEAVFCGPFDLSMSLGIFRQFENPIFQEAIERIVSTCQAHGVIAGLLAPIGPVQASIKYGFKMISLGGDLPILTQAVSTALKAARNAANAHIPK